MDIIDTKHIKKTIEFMKERAEEYAAEAARYAELDMPNLQGWYEGRGDAFASAAAFLQTDLNVFAEDIDAPIAHLIGEA